MGRCVAKYGVVLRSDTIEPSYIGILSDDSAMSFFDKQLSIHYELDV